MVANLFEHHDEVQHQSPALDAAGAFDFFQGFVHNPLIKCSLFGAEGTKLVLLHFARQVADDGFIGF